MYENNKRESCSDVEDVNGGKIVQRVHEAQVLPIIDGIDPDSFEISNDEGIRITRLGFTWDLSQKSLPMAYDRSAPDYQSSPAMAGGLFAIRRDWFA